MSLAVAAVIAIVAFLPPSPEEAGSERSAIQRNFLPRIETAQERVSAAPNSLAFHEVLELRDSQLADFSSVEEWSGTVLGVQNMQGKGAISIDIGGAKGLAGIHLTYGLDTLIPPSQGRIYNELLSLQRGDKVQFSGSFSIHNGSLVEMSYTGSGAISTPEFWFQFSALTPRD